MNDIMKVLRDKDDKKAYAMLKEIIAKSATSEEYYSYFDDFSELMNAKNSYVRIRGFTLCCAQARWDERGKLKNILPGILAQLHDDKPSIRTACLH